MDEIQKKLVEIVKNYPRCLSNQVMLRGLLMDILNDNRLEINLIMNAYALRIVERLQKSNNYTFTLSGIKKQLLQEYGLTEENGTWAIVSWCYMLGLGDAAKMTEELCKPAWEEDSVSSKSSLRNSLFDFLTGKGLEVIDKRPSGGCLWVVGTEEKIGGIIRVAELLFSITGVYCSGGRATGYRPGWYTISNE